MKQLFSKNVISYSVLFFFIVVLSGIVLIQFTTNYLVLFSVLVIEYIVLILVFLYFFEKYVKPLHKVIRTIDKLLQGNYYARINQELNGTIGELSMKINSLARNLSELTIQEQIQA